VDSVRYISGDVWNVNPPALARVPRLFCQNERAVLPLSLNHSTEAVALVPVAAILVASIQLAFLKAPFDLRDRGPHVTPCRHPCLKGEELGHFRHGSTIVVIGTAGLSLCPGVSSGSRILMGQPLLDHHTTPVVRSGTR
jgi:phosphatidylserine decarboxylase